MVMAYWISLSLTLWFVIMVVVLLALVVVMSHLLSPLYLLTLDEVTSSIDIRTAADLILVMEQGWLIEWGTHSALVAKKGFCAKLQKTE